MRRRADGDDDDRYWMHQALALGSLADDTTSPNPRVGCVLVREGRAVGRGYHRAVGSPHAEAQALADAGDLARGSTAYVNLEPCAHHGRTPPCADALIRAGVRRVVAALQDPNPLVNGRGFRRLREGGAEVEVGLLADWAERINEPFLHSFRAGRPLVTLKAAISLDGMIAGRAGNSRWISGEPARRFAHRLRSRHDAVLVGAETLRRDDPRLTVRLPGSTRDPLRVVLAPTLNVDPAAELFRARERDTRLPRIYLTDEPPADRRRAFDRRAEIVPVGRSGGGIDLPAVMADLASVGVQSVLVEGGARTFGTFLDAGLADRAALFLARKLIGARGGTPLIDRESAAEPAAGWRLVESRQLALGPDLLLLGRLVPPEGARSRRS